MPKVNLTQEYVGKIPKLFSAKPLTRIILADTKVQGLVVVVEPSGSIYYALRSYNRDKKMILARIAPCDAIELKNARETVSQMHFEEQKTKEEEPCNTRKKVTMGDIYAEYVKFKFPDGNQSPKKADDIVIYRQARTNRMRLSAIKKNFEPFFTMPYYKVDKLTLTQWGQELLLKRHGELKACSVNKAINALRGMVRWAFDIGLIKEYPYDHFRLLRDPQEKNQKGRRCLTQEELDRLMQVLDEREEDRRSRRCRYNASYAIRYKHKGEPLPEYLPKGEGYTDYLIPMVILALYTGARKGSILGLRWKDINYAEDNIYYQGEMSKAGNTIIVPMNAIVKDMLIKWQRQNNITNTDADLKKFVFTGKDGISPLDNSSPNNWEKIMAKAEISNFRWHDLRHTFASILAKNNIDIVTLQALLGHSDIKTTSIYLHPDNTKLKNAVGVMQNMFVCKN